MIKAIDTYYNGYRFRSRTEARWAVFFDEMGIVYEYEKEGFALPSGPYLPDFWLPNFGVGGSYAEVKGESFTDDETQKCRELCKAMNKPVIKLEGIPAFKRYGLIGHIKTSACSNCSEGSAEAFCNIGLLDMVRSMINEYADQLDVKSQKEKTVLRNALIRVKEGSVIEIIINPDDVSIVIPYRSSIRRYLLTVIDIETLELKIITHNHVACFGKRPPNFELCAHGIIENLGIILQKEMWVTYGWNELKVNDSFFEDFFSKEYNTAVKKSKSARFEFATK